jgi:hypothetical protein
MSGISSAAGVCFKHGFCEFHEFIPIKGLILGNCPGCADEEEVLHDGYC